MTTDDFSECYDILEVEPGASLEEIRIAYTDLVKVWHPDRYANESQRLRTKAEEKLKLINTAYERLRTGKTGPAIRTRPGPRHQPAPPPPRAKEEVRGLRPQQFGDRWGYVDREDRIVLRPEYAQADHFFEGLARVAIPSISGRLKSGYINSDGEYVIPPQFLQARRFVDGLAAVVFSTKWGYVDTTGQYVIHPEFEEVSDFRNANAAVKQRGRWGFIDREGKYLLPPKFEAAEPFDGLWAKVVVGGQSGKVNREGEVYLDGGVKMV